MKTDALPEKLSEAADEQLRQVYATQIVKAVNQTQSYNDVMYYLSAIESPPFTRKPIVERIAHALCLMRLSLIVTKDPQFCAPELIVLADAMMRVADRRSGISQFMVVNAAISCYQRAAQFAALDPESAASLARARELQVRHQHAD